MIYKNGTCLVNEEPRYEIRGNKESEIEEFIPLELFLGDQHGLAIDLSHDFIGPARISILHNSLFLASGITSSIYTMRAE